MLTETQRFITPRVMATRKLFTVLLKFDILCLFDFFHRSWCFMFWNIYNMFLRVAQIFHSRISSGTHKFNDYFRNYQFTSISPRVDLKVRNQYIEQLLKGTPMRCWRWLLGARLEMSETTTGQLFQRIILENVCCFMTDFYFYKKVRRRCITHV